jgi:hypothetical protein
MRGPIARDLLFSAMAIGLVFLVAHTAHHF